MIRFLSLKLVLILILILTSCNNITNKKVNIDSFGDNSSNYPMRVIDSLNREIFLKEEPKRIISIAPNITETIFALKKQDKLVGRSNYCDYPEGVQKISSVGEIEEPSIEKILELNPDIVVASTHFKKDILYKLEKLKIKVVILYGEESFEGVYTTISKLGQVLNAKSQADELIADMQNKVKFVTNKVENLKKPDIYYVISFGKFGDFTAGSDTYISKIIEMAGGNNIAGDTKSWNYKLEKLIEKNPPMLVCSKYFNSKEQIKSTNGYNTLKAVINNDIYEIDNNLLDRQGPRLADGLIEMAKIIHPEIFRNLKAIS